MAPLPHAMKYQGFWLAVFVLLCATGMSPARAEERARYEDAAAYRAYGQPSARAADPNVAPLRERAGRPSFGGGVSHLDTGVCPQSCLLRDLARPSGTERSSKAKNPLDLCLKRSDPKQRTEPSPRLGAGFGDIFPDDRAGRSRMNGAGLQDPNTVFLKLRLVF